MLRRLRIENLAVVERAELEFGPGFNVLTGSTGAGKSLIVGAVNLLLGEKAGADLIRRGADEATVEAVFEGLTAGAHPDLAAHIENGTLRASRRIARGGRSSAALGGRPVTVRDLRAACTRLIEPHGQNEQYRLRDPESHVEYLDAFAGHAALRGQFALALARWRRARADLDRFEAEIARLRERAELFAHRLQEIERIAPRAGEKADLEARAARMANAERIFAAIEDACASLYDEDGAAAAQVGHARHRVDAIGPFEPRAGAIVEKLAQAEALIAEAAAEAREVRDSLDFDPADVERVQERLDVLVRLERRYQAGIESILEERETWRRGLEGLEDADAGRAALTGEVEARARDVAAAGEALTASRRAAATRLDAAVSAELETLMMRGARLRTEIVAVEDAGGIAIGGRMVAVFEHGLDAVRMRVRTNPGEAEGPLETIASTGELSRIALVLKPLAAAGTAGNTLIFDEIDAGVGADLGDALAEKLLALSGTHQIICITHMAQIAARGHTHLVVQKETDDDRTQVRVRAVDGAGRADEIARMLGGRDGSEQRRALAREMLDSPPRPRRSPRVRP